MSRISTHDAAYVHRIEMNDAIHTRLVSGFSKSIVRSFWYRDLAIDSLTRYATPLASTITRRIAKIHTSSLAWMTGSRTASMIKVMSATPVTPYVSKPSAVGPTESP